MCSKTVNNKVLFVILLLCCLLVFSGCSSKEENVTPILEPQTASLSTAEKWAIENLGTDTFVSLAYIYWEKAPQIGINPVVAYCQCALETGFSHFGGVIDETYCNPCGMKVGRGGGDHDPNAHAKFDNWQCGVMAHLDHLALYAHADGFPKTDTYDTRHFMFIWEQGKNQIEKTDDCVGLSGWASDPDYCGKLINLIESLEAMESRIIDKDMFERIN